MKNEASCLNCSNCQPKLAVCIEGLEKNAICDDHKPRVPPFLAARRPNFHGQHMVVLAEGHEARTEHAFQRARGKASTPQWLLAHLDRAREETRTLRKYCQDVLAGSP